MTNPRKRKHIQTHASDGANEKRAFQVFLEMLFMKNYVRRLENWSVYGTLGCTSNDYFFNELFVCEY